MTVHALGWFDPEITGRAWFDSSAAGAPPSFDRELVDSVIEIEASATLTGTGSLSAVGAATASAATIGLGGMTITAEGAAQAAAAGALIGRGALHARALRGSIAGAYQPRHWIPSGRLRWRRRVP